MMMADVHHILSAIWYLIAAMILLIYVLVDGFDLGVGVLTSAGADKPVGMIGRLDPVWDANEVWLILLAVVVVMVFPGSSAAAVGKLRIPLLIMCAGLVIRCRSIAIRRRTDGRQAGVYAFAIGSLLAVLGQGLIFGLSLEGNAGMSATAWLTPLSLAALMVVLCAYATLGATYLIRQGGPFNHRRAAVIALMLLLAVALLGLAAPHVRAGLAAKWATPTGRGIEAALGTTAVTGFFMIFYTLHRQWRRAPFCWSVVTISALFCGLVLSLYPYVVPDTVTAYQAAAPNQVLVYALATIGIVIPVVLFFNGYQHLTTYQGDSANDEQ